MTNDPSGDAEPGLLPKWIAGVLVGLCFGVVVGLAVVVHDGSPWSDGVCAGLGFFAFGFALGYFKFARAIAELFAALG